MFKHKNPGDIKNKFWLFGKVKTRRYSWALSITLENRSLNIKINYLILYKRKMAKTNKIRNNALKMINCTCLNAFNLRIDYIS